MDREIRELEWEKWMLEMVNSDKARIRHAEVVKELTLLKAQQSSR